MGSTGSTNIKPGVLYNAVGTSRAVAVEGQNPARLGVTKSITGNELMTRYENSSRDDRLAINQLRDARNEVRASAAGIQKTLDQAATKEGAFRVGFNDDNTRARLQRILGNGYEFRRVTAARNTVIPGRSFAGYPIRGDIVEWRLFRRKR